MKTFKGSQAHARHDCDFHDATVLRKLGDVLDD